MVTVSPKSPRKAKKSSVLPEGIEQLAFFSSMTPVPTVIAKAKASRKARKPVGLPEGVQQLDFLSLIPSNMDGTVEQSDIFRLIAAEFGESELDPTIKPQPAATQPRQLTIDDILAMSPSEVEIPPAQTLEPEAEYEQPRQITIDDVIDASPSEVTISLTQPLKPETEYEQPRQSEQLDFDALGESSPSDVGAVPERKQAGGGARGNGDEIRGSALRPDGNSEDELSSSLGDGNRSNSSARPRRRIILDESERDTERSRDFRIAAAQAIGADGQGPEVSETNKLETAALLASTKVRAEADIEQELSGRRVYLKESEPEPPLSHDFRIRSEHGVGEGGLRQKAQANIEAIRLLKTLEAENREATDDEKAILVKYAGWGALAIVFEPDFRLRSRPEWQEPAAELRELLSKEEYESARATTPNAHFTSPMVIGAIWQGLEKLGVQPGAEILEPSMGIGHFFGLMPEGLRGGHRTGVELDSITARVAKKLYPDSTVFHKGFEETALPDNYFDAVIGNVPFGNYPVHDPGMKHSLTRSIHDYFFAKSLEKTRPGGMIALVTSRYTMDKKDDTIRKHLAESADLVAAVRLPNTAFKGNAGTDVTTDILFLRKRAEGEEATGEKWTESGTTQINGHEISLNEYYIRHPEMMLGEMQLIRGMHHDQEPTLTGELTQERLQEALKALPEAIYTPRDQGRSPPQPARIVEPESFIGIKDGGYAIVEGQIVRWAGGTFEPVSLSANAAGRVRGMIQIRDAVHEVFKTQLDDKPETQIVAARQQLNHIYNQFVGQHGYISSRDNSRAFTGDPDHALLLSLENYDAEKKTATKTAVFERRTLERYKPVEHVETAAEALAISLNEQGAIDWQRMAALTGASIKQVQVELSGQVYQNPGGGAWQTADEYLSGDVRAKLRAAEAAAEINPAYRSNVEALKMVQPPDIPPGDINARLGTGWIPKSDIKTFICELLQIRPNDVAVGHAGEIATWSVKLDRYAEQYVTNTTTFGTKRVVASELIEAALNMRTPTIYDYHSDGTSTMNQLATIAAREAQQKIKDRFAKWIWEDPARTERLARLYNDTFNTIRLRTYDGSHLTLPGMNRTGLRQNDLDPHQKNAVWRMLQNKNTLIGHVVGAGKTASITAGAMELKRLGLASKSMIVVPNHLVEQWGSEFLKLYPQANIFVAGKEHFTAGNREKAMARIATGNYDAVIISHKSFESLPVSNATFNRFVGKQIASLEEAILEASSEKSDNRSVVKDLEKAKKRLEAKIKDRTRRENKDDGVTWEQLGVDRIFVDEADLFKNLGFTTKMNRIAGLPNTESNRALDMYMKTQYLNERGGGTVFATGTPISNTMAEMYTLMRYLAPEVLKAAGVEHFDAWAANFGDAVTALELAPDGSGYRMHTRFAKFVNMPELLSMFRTFADVQTADMLNLPRPNIEGGKPRVVAAPASPELKEYVADLVARAQRIRSGSVNPRKDNMLKITGDGRKAALDMRIVAGAETNDAYPTKVSQAIDNIRRIWEEGAEKRLTQAVFCDLSTPNDGFNVYGEVRSQLIERGIPEKEIAFIHDADTDAKKKQLFDAVNAGRIRVLLGSTEKMGAGTNIQKKLVALHHLDAPWRPRDIEQRDGRILRQGNENKEIQIYRYVTEGSFDAYMWQTLETKQRFIEQVMNGKTSVREAEDLESNALSFAEIKAIASGNPAVLEKVKIDTEIRKLDMLRSAHVNQQFDIRQLIGSLPKKIEDSRAYHAGLLEDIARRNTNDYEEFTMIVGGRRVAGKGAREEAGEALVEAIMAAKGDFTLRVRGQVAGFEILSSGNPNGSEYMPQLYIRGKHSYRVNFNPDSGAGTIARIENVLRHLDTDSKEEKSKYERWEKALTEYQGQLHIPFEHEDRLRELLIKQQQVNSQLDLDKGDSQAAAIALEVDGQGLDERIAPQPEQSERGSHAEAVVEQATSGALAPSPDSDAAIQQSDAAEPQQAHASGYQMEQQSPGSSNIDGQVLTPETVNLFSSARIIQGLFTCQVGEKSPHSRIVIVESKADAMAYYQVCGGKAGLYIALADENSSKGKVSPKQENALRQILARNPQAKVITATDADRDGEKYAVLINSIRPDASRARPGVRERSGIRYESWNDVLTNSPMQPQAVPSQQQQPGHEAGAAHEVVPNVTPIHWGNRGRSAISPNVD